MILLLAGLPLLDNDSEDSDEIDMKPGGADSRHRLRSTSNSDDYYLRETRTWTSVKDKHLQSKNEGPNSSDIFQNTKNTTIKEEEKIVNLSDD